MGFPGNRRFENPAGPVIRQRITRGLLTVAPSHGHWAPSSHGPTAHISVTHCTGRKASGHCRVCCPCHQALPELPRGIHEMFLGPRDGGQVCTFADVFPV